jgi:hypothetical protein
MKVHIYNFRSESGDDYSGGGWIEKPTKEELAKFIIIEHWGECQYWLNEEGKSQEWAKENPLSALDICLIYPELESFEVLDKIPQI